ncbi:MAG: glucose-6-phosphate dehydrogenase [Nitrospirota bacterium]
MSNKKMVPGDIKTGEKKSNTAPSLLVIFGGSGDLARRKLVPAMYNLYLDGSLPEGTVILGLGRKEMSHEGFRATLREAAEKFSRQRVETTQWEIFEKSIYYLAGEIEKQSLYDDIRDFSKKMEAGYTLPGTHFFYLAIPPTSFSNACQGLRKADLVLSPEGVPCSRVIVEKPIGHDLESARAINDVISDVFQESQIYRIDHYLGKESVQNLLVFRFANSIFEPLWNNHHIDSVQITSSEEEGVGTRATYYDGSGALRDMVQNHLLQLLCLVAMEPPWSLDPNVVRDARLDVLRTLRPIVGKGVDQYTVRAQYAPPVEASSLLGYKSEDGISPDSMTETFVAIKAFVDNWRWANVPFYLRTGKRMEKRTTEIVVQFKSVPQILFNANPDVQLNPNLLVLRIQPDEGFSIQLISKRPGSKVHVLPVHMDFQYNEQYGGVSPEAYERLLMDVMIGDPTLFMRRDAVEAAWHWVTDILEGWKKQNIKWLPEYPSGSWGPEESENMLSSDGRKWRNVT